MGNVSIGRVLVKVYEFKGVIFTLVKEGRNAVNVATDRWLEVPEDMNIEVGDVIELGNGKDYKVIKFFGDGYVRVGPPNK